MNGTVAAVRASAPGKVNLILRVAPPDACHYHPLFTVFETLNLREDVLAVLRKPVPTRDSARGENPAPSITVTNRVQVDAHTDAATGAALNQLDLRQHLAWRAAEVVATAGDSPRCRALRSGQLELALTVVKRIPMAGGMAGGSADAAAALVAVNEVLEAGLSADQLLELGRSLGADVPACLAGSMSVAAGYGDRIVRLMDSAPHHWVMLTAHEGLSTPAVFDHYDRHVAATSGSTGSHEGAAALPDDLTPAQAAAITSGAAQLAPHLVNDLQQVALSLRADLRETMRKLGQTGALAAVLSGSGPTIAVLAEDARQAQELAAQCSQWDSVSAVITTNGPSAPARLEPLDPPEGR